MPRHTHTHTSRKFLMKRKTAVHSSPERKMLSIIQIQIRTFIPRAEGTSDIKVQRLHAFLSVASLLESSFLLYIDGLNQYPLNTGGQTGEIAVVSHPVTLYFEAYKQSSFPQSWLLMSSITHAQNSLWYCQLFYF